MIVVLIPIFVFVIFLAYSFIRNQKENQVRLPENQPSWQSKYTALIESFDKQNIETFYNEICKLGKRYKYPPNARNIYFQSYQFLAKQNSNYALLLYLQYLHVKTPSANFRHKKVSEEYKKMLFRNKAQETRFQQLCDQLKENHNLPQAIEETKRFFRINRREINLDTQAIEDVGREHSQMAELLGKYLEDEPEIVDEIPVSSTILPDNTNESELFRLFEQNNFTLNKKEVDTFARNNGMFCDSLIQQINETYYETLDDVLIEDEEENYMLNKAYYESIKQ